MIALLRKDLPWILACGFGGVVVLTIALMGAGFVGTWVLPPMQLPALFRAGWICGVILGLSGSMFDEVLRTRELLQHRPANLLALHAARVRSCAAVLLCWGLLPPLLAFCQEALIGSYTNTGRPAHIAYVWLALLPCATASAIGLFAGSLPFSFRGRLLTATGLLITVFTLITMSTEPSSEVSQAAVENSLPIFAGLHLGAALLLLFASFATAGARRDDDRPWSSSVLFLGCGATTITVALLMSAIFGSFERALSAGLLKQYPAIFRVSGGEHVLINRDELRLGERGPIRGPVVTYLLVDAEHRALGPLDRVGEGFVFAPYSAWENLRGFRAPRLHWRSSNSYFEDGRLVVLQRDASQERLSVLTAGKGRDQAPFAADAERVPLFRFDAGTIHVVLERVALKLWKFDREAGYFVAFELPNGDRLKDVRSFTGWGDTGNGVRFGTEEGHVFIGEREAYRLQSEGFESMPESERSSLAETEPEVPRYRAQTDDDVMSPQVRIFDASGAVVFEHQYAPHTSSERWTALMLLGWSVCRPPILAAVAHAFVSPASTANPIFDPLVAGGRRLWLVAVDLALGALCAAISVFRLRRFGAERRVRWFWGVLALLLGVVALCASFKYEHRRAWSRGPEPETVREPRIVSNARRVEVLA